MKKNKKAISMLIMLALITSMLSGFCFFASAEETMGETDIVAQESTPLPDNVYPKPEITPPPDHPRLLFRQDDIATIKTNLNSEENANAKTNFEGLAANKELTGMLDSIPNKSNYAHSILIVVEAKAFDYVINGNVENGKAAIEIMKNINKTMDYEVDTYISRAYGHNILVTSMVYDWCYPLLTDEDKAIFIADCERMASLMDIGWPPKKGGYIVGSDSESQISKDLLAFAIAVYDERPDIYNYIAGKIFEEFVPPRKFWYQSHSHHQGSGFGATRYGWDLWAVMLFKQMTGVNILDDNFFKAGYELIYLRRPDGQTFRLGDDHNALGIRGKYWGSYAQQLFIVASLGNDPYFKRELQRELRNMPGYAADNHGLYTSVLHLILNDPNLKSRPIGELPLTYYFGSPNGIMIARTGWSEGFNSPDAAVLMKIGEVWAGEHNQLDVGSFQLYYKGDLACETGYSDQYLSNHDVNYNKQTIAHNALLIFDPNEVPYGGVANAGGQRRPGDGPADFEEWMKDDNYVMGKVIGHEFGPDPVRPEYSYIKGDITKAYGEKAEEVLRSMLFMPLEDPEHRAAFFVMDKITSSDPSFKKTFLLHTKFEPQIDGSITTVIYDEVQYNGKMIVETLLPKDAVIEKVGGEGKEFWINGKNYPSEIEKFDKNSPKFNTLEYSWGRLEISPPADDKTDYFLNVMTVKDADSPAADLKSTLIEGDSFVGAVVSNKAAIFAKDANRIEGSISFTVPGSGDFDVLVAGIKEGTWTVTSAAGEQEAIATADGGVIYFTAPAGDVTITYKDANATRPEIKPEIPELDLVGIKIDNMFIYSDVEPTIKDGRTLVPLRVIFEALGAEVSYDEATATATATKEFRTVQISENSKTAYVDGIAYELDVSATIENGRFLVPVRFVSEALDAKVDWDPFASVVYITSQELKPRGAEYAKIIGCSASLESGINFAVNTYDNDFNTLWAAEGEHFIIYELDQEYTIAAVEIMLNQNMERNAIFEVQSSVDGTNFTSIYSGTGDGQVGKGGLVFEKFEFEQPVKAKYIKYIGKGSNLTMWNGVREIKFVVAK